MKDAIGWASSLVLLGTIIWQIRAQWQAGSSKGVSSWLFVGQIVASSGFAIYSYMIGNWVFVSTNVFMAISAVVGLFLVRHHRRKEGKRRGPDGP